MDTLRDIKDKVFLISGAASGLGAGFAEAFLKEGAEKIAILDIAEKLGQETANRLNQSYPGSTVFIKCDVSKEEDINEAFEKVVGDFGKVDVIINNAGIMNDSEDFWRTACEVNLQGVVSLTLKGVEHMRKDLNPGSSGGTIINISSTVAIMKTPPLPIYSGCKSAVLLFSTLLATDPFFETTGVRILTMCFGATDTPLLQNLQDRSYDKAVGEEFARQTVEKKVVFQKPESAVRGTVDMFKHGAGGSVWVVNNNRPAIDITSIVNGAYEDMTKAVIALTS